jgi:hypothetical protein
VGTAVHRLPPLKAKEYIMGTIHVALVSQSSQIDDSEVSSVAAALQNQATRDFAPIWSIQATVDHFKRLEDVPLGYWPIIVKDNIGQPGAGGFHTDKNHQPFALVQAGSMWSIAASHECLEMLVDPFGNRLVSGPSLAPGQGDVNYLVEVGDPVEDAQFAYLINGVMVSDFYTPRYLDVDASRGVLYDFRGAVSQPRQVLENGYISWFDPASGDLFQINLIEDPTGNPIDLGPAQPPPGQSLREYVDGLVQKRVKHNTPMLARHKDAVVERAKKAHDSHRKSCGTRAKNLQKHIDELIKGGN